MFPLPCVTVGLLFFIFESLTLTLVPIFGVHEAKVGRTPTERRVVVSKEKKEGLDIEEISHQHFKAAYL